MEQNSVYVIFFGVSCVLLSASLITFNNYLISDARFPYAIPLVMLHMLVSFCVCGIYFLVQPSMFPSLKDVSLGSVASLYKALLPISFFFVAQLVLSNTAYLYSTVPFLQMMKESNLVVVYFFSLLFALEAFRFRNLYVLLLIVLATSLTVKGEIHFSGQGFTLQGSSQLCEGLKIVLMSMLLSVSGNKKVDPLSFVLMMTPWCLLFMCMLATVLYYHPFGGMRMPDSLEPLRAWWPLLLLNACVAAALNILSSFFLKYASPISFVLSGIVKDVMIVIVNARYMGDAITLTQTVGFTLQLLGVLLWSMMKSYPEQFKDGFLSGMRRVFSSCMGRMDTAAESSRLVPPTAKEKQDVI